jgi:RNA polymerase sigma-70 factor (ECF subfamily)
MLKANIDTEELIQLLRKRDNGGFSILYDRYSTALFGIIFKITKDEAEAENLLQDTFVKIWKKIQDFNAEKGTLFTWMLNIARNTAIDYLRSKNYLQQANNQNIDSSVNMPIHLSNVVNIEFIGIRELVEKLEPIYQKAINMVYYEGYTHEEAAENLQIPLGTLKTRIRIAVRELKKLV